MILDTSALNILTALISYTAALPCFLFVAGWIDSMQDPSF